MISTRYYKNIALIALLLPVASYSKSNEVRIKELKEAQFQKELEISNVSEMIDKKGEFFSNYKSSALDCLTTIQEKNESSKSEDEMENLLDQFIKNIGVEFDGSKDIKQMFKNGLDSKGNNESLRVALLRVMLEQRLIQKLIIKYEECAQELIMINQELINLKK